MVLFSGCIEGEEDPNDPVIAQVYNKKLHYSDLLKILPEGISGGDSILFQNAYVEQWVRERLLLREAERNLSEQLDIDQLVEDYRSSLINHHYVKNVIAEQLDTVIGDLELHDHYEKNKLNYTLETTIVRARFMIIPKKPDGELYSETREIWNYDSPQEFRKLVEFANREAKFFLLNDSTWYNLEAIQDKMPEGSINPDVIKYTKDYTINGDTHYYFLKILEVKDKTAIAPLSYIKERATRAILHERKQGLLDKLKADLYQKESKGENVQIYL